MLSMLSARDEHVNRISANFQQCGTSAEHLLNVSPMFSLGICDRNFFCENERIMSNEKKLIPKDRFGRLAAFLKLALQEVERVERADVLHERGVKMDGWNTLVRHADGIQFQLAKIAGATTELALFDINSIHLDGETHSKRVSKKDVQAIAKSTRQKAASKGKDDKQGRS